MSIKKKIISLVFLLALITACQSKIFPNEDVQFLVFNRSNQKAWVKVFAQDKKRNSETLVGEPKEIASFESVASGDSTAIIAANLKRFSNTGRGIIMISFQKEGEKDTTKSRATDYSDYDFYDRELLGPFAIYNTIEILLRDSSWYPHYANYKNGKRLSLSVPL